jgi:hypothetical protein
MVVRHAGLPKAAAPLDAAAGIFCRCASGGYRLLCFTIKSCGYQSGKTAGARPPGRVGRRQTLNWQKPKKMPQVHIAAFFSRDSVLPG